MELWLDFYEFAKENEHRVIDLPHDAMIGGKRLPEYGNASGFFLRRQVYLREVLRS